MLEDTNSLDGAQIIRIDGTRNNNPKTWSWYIKGRMYGHVRGFFVDTNENYFFYSRPLF